MFSTATATHRNAAQFANAYRQVGAETAVSGASPHKLISMLFDGYLEAVAQARYALKNGDIEAKGRATVRAVRIVDEGLRCSLDLQSGGELAQDLHSLYGYLTMRLTLSNVRNDDAGFDECQRLLQPVRDAWVAIGDKPAVPAAPTGLAVVRTAQR